MSVGVLENLFVPFHLGPGILALVVQLYTFLYHQLLYTLERFCEDNFHTFFPSIFVSDVLSETRVLFLSLRRATLSCLSFRHINFGRDVSHWEGTWMPALQLYLLLNFSVLANLEGFTRLEKKRRRKTAEEMYLNFHWEETDSLKRCAIIQGDQLGKQG